MAKPNSAAERAARAAAARIDRQVALGEQLSFLADEEQPGESKAMGRTRGKAQSGLAKWLAHQGYRSPEDQLARMAGLHTDADPFTTAMLHTERVLDWAYSIDGSHGEGKQAPPAKRLLMFGQLYAAQLRATEALLPYGLAKASTDTVVNQSTTVVVAAGPSDPGAAARVVSPDPGSRMAPPPLPQEIEQKQVLGAAQLPESDDGSRTE